MSTACRALRKHLEAQIVKSKYGGLWSKWGSLHKILRGLFLQAYARKIRCVFSWAPGSFSRNRRYCRPSRSTVLKEKLENAKMPVRSFCRTERLVYQKLSMFGCFARLYASRREMPIVVAQPGGGSWCYKKKFLFKFEIYIYGYTYIYTFVDLRRREKFNTF